MSTIVVSLKRGAPVSEHESFTAAQALALALVFYVADWCVEGARSTVVDPTGRHRIASAIASNLKARGLLREGHTLQCDRLQSIFKITGKGQRAVRALEKRGWDLEWLKANQKPTKAQRFEKRWAELRGGAS